MSNTSLEGVEHTFEFTRKGEDHVCVVRVTLPDSTVQTFEATCATKHAARVIAVFKASFAVKCARDYSEPAMQPEQDAPAPSEEGVEASGESSPKSLDVESHDMGAQNDMLIDAPVDQYSSSAEDDDDELPVARKRRNTPSAPIAFVPAPDTALKPSFTGLESDEIQPNGLVERASLERSSLGDAELQHDKEVLDVTPARERSRESSEVEDGERIDSDRECLQRDNDYKSLLAKRKKKYSLAKPKLPSPRESSPEVHEISTSSRKRVKRFRTEPLPSSRRVSTRREPREYGYSKASARPGSSTQKRRVSRDEAGAHESTKRERRPRRIDKSSTETREIHNAELPVTSSCIDHNERIPRHNQGQKSDDIDLDMTQTPAYNQTSFYPQQPQVGSVPHATNHGQIPASAPPFEVHPMYQGTPAHPIAFSSPYMAPHLAQQPPHIGASFPSGAPYAPTHNPMLASPYIPTGFPPHMMPQAMGGYPYPQPMPNGTHQFYHPQTPAAFHTPQLSGDQKVQHEAEIIAAAAKRTAELAAEAAAQDAARNARSDFEANQREKQAEQKNGAATIQGRKHKKGFKASRSEPEKESVTHGNPTTGPITEQRQDPGDGTKMVDIIPREEGDLGDYMSTLHKMAQKGQVCANLSSASFVTVRSKGDPRCGQQCTLSVRFVLDSENEDAVITKTAIATKKKIAKQLAAKALLAEIEDRMKAQPQSSEEEAVQKDKTGQTSLQKKNSGITTAVAALHRLYTLNVLYGPPVFKPEEPAGGPNKGTWRSVVIVEIKDVGKRTFEEFAVSKKIARQRCAFKAFEALKEMNVPGIDSFANITKEGRDLENETATAGNNATGNTNEGMVPTEAAAPIEAIVEVSEDEDTSNPSVDEELAPSDDRLSLPKDYKLVFPSTESECAAWLKDNSEIDAQFGLFVDSPRARTVFANSVSQPHQEAVKDQQTLQPRFLCLSTATNGMVLCFPEAVSTEATTPSAEDDSVSLPEVVVDMLEDPTTKKSGFALEDGISVLELEEDFRTQSIDDVSILSLAITGVETVKRKGPLATLPELIKRWLRKETGKINVRGVWKEPGDIPERLKAKDGKAITIGVLASYACFCISQQMRPAARQKRTRTHGVAAAFLHLSEQLMSPAPA